MIRVTSPYVLSQQEVDNSQQKVVRIRTSDRNTFKICRRRWGWSSKISGEPQNYREGKDVSPALWLGTAIHAALEDYHGHRRYKNAIEAFTMYYHQSVREGKAPDNGSEIHLQGVKMLEYYQKWINEPHRQKFNTLYQDGKPLVEAHFEIPLPNNPGDGTFLGERMEEAGIDKVIYQGTIDRVALDEDGLLWIMEYKTAAQYRHSHLDFDPQITAYLWAARVLWPNHKIGGVIYQQHHKTPPTSPRILSNGQLSTSYSQNTTALLYRESIDNIYGSVMMAPDKVRQFYESLLTKESEDQDRGVWWDRMTRSCDELNSEFSNILLEVGEMIDPEVVLYPTMGAHCLWCDFKEPCTIRNSGGDYVIALETMTKRRSG